MRAQQLGHVGLALGRAPLEQQPDGRVGARILVLRRRARDLREIFHVQAPGFGVDVAIEPGDEQEVAVVLAAAHRATGRRWPTAVAETDLAGVHAGGGGQRQRAVFHLGKPVVFGGRQLADEMLLVRLLGTHHVASRRRPGPAPPWAGHPKSRSAAAWAPARSSFRSCRGSGRSGGPARPRRASRHPPRRRRADRRRRLPADRVRRSLPGRGRRRAACAAVPREADSGRKAAGRTCRRRGSRPGPGPAAAPRSRLRPRRSPARLFRLLPEVAGATT